MNFILAHLSGFSDDWRAQLALIDLVTASEYLYGYVRVRRFDLLEQAVKRAGPRRCCLGRTARGCIPGSK